MHVFTETLSREADTILDVEQSVARTFFTKRDDLIQKLQEIENDTIRINEE